MRLAVIRAKHEMETLSKENDQKQEKVDELKKQNNSLQQ